MATSIALVLTTAAITACGGGSADAQSQTQEAETSINSGASGVADSASAASTGVFATTNTTAVADAANDAAGAPTSVATGTAATSTSTSTATTETATAEAASAGEAPVNIAANTVATTSAISVGTTAPTSGGGGTSTSNPGTPTSTVVARPAGNTGTGFYVSGGKLYDAKGKEFRIRGVNRNHFDSWGSDAGIPLSGANAERTVPYFSRTAAQNLADLKKITDAGIVPMPGMWNGTCKSDVASLNSMVDTWVAQAATWTKLNNNGLVNIANEWGPPNSVVWRDAYISAIARMRAAGYTGTLVVDSGGCGQDAQDIVKYGADVLASDPQKNILFDVHVYGGFSFPATVSWQQDYTKSMAALKATGLAIVIGEFGPGNRIGPSPTAITPQQVIATAEANSWGWMAWSWDDNNLGGCKADDHWFSMTTTCGVYKTEADLTTFGKTVVPILKSTAVKASIFN